MDRRRTRTFPHGRNRPGDVEPGCVRERARRDLVHAPGEELPVYRVHRSLVHLDLDLARSSGWSLHIGIKF